jgi:hypothetical protein
VHLELSSVLVEKLTLDRLASELLVDESHERLVLAGGPGLEGRGNGSEVSLIRLCDLGEVGGPCLLGGGEDLGGDLGVGGLVLLKQVLLTGSENDLLVVLVSDIASSDVTV